mmetsp:Transcript_5985/g.12604  ORF Transcript_5985/g.12604 Transcript_5985/m.12604 type:complete len:234 (-) Transcript_5985:22-723(-)
MILARSNNDLPCLIQTQIMSYAMTRSIWIVVVFVFVCLRRTTSPRQLFHFFSDKGHHILLRIRSCGPRIIGGGLESGAEFLAQGFLAHGFSGFGDGDFQKFGRIVAVAGNGYAFIATGQSCRVQLFRQTNARPHPQIVFFHRHAHTGRGRFHLFHGFRIIFFGCGVTGATKHGQGRCRVPRRRHRRKGRNRSRRGQGQNNRRGNLHDDIDGDKGDDRVLVVGLIRRLSVAWFQ